MYPWGDQIGGGHLLNFADRSLEVGWTDVVINDGHEFTAPVGSFPAGASPYGALDMAGNVYEWTADWYKRDYYPTAPFSNPPGPTSGGVKVLRGGAWISGAEYARTAFRNWKAPDVPHDIYGFRCVYSSP